MTRTPEDPRAALTRHEEELRIDTRPVVAGDVRARKVVETGHVSAPVERNVERLEAPERVAANEQDSGLVETLPDGSISIPIMEEELVVTKRLVVRERVILRKRVEVVHQVVNAELRRERVEIERDGPHEP